MSTVWGIHDVAFLPAEVDILGSGASISSRDVLLQVGQFLAVLSVAWLIQGIIVQFEERVQRARGPGTFQPYRDLWKLFHKQIVIPETASWLFWATPVVAFTCMLTVPTLPGADESSAPALGCQKGAERQDRPPPRMSPCHDAHQSSGRICLFALLDKLVIATAERLCVIQSGHLNSIWPGSTRCSSSFS